MQEIVEIFTNNGLAIACVIYIIYFNLTTMKDISKNMDENNKVLQTLVEEIKEIRKK